MATGAHTTETLIKLRLSGRARARLAEQAARSGQDVSAVASDLIEQAVVQPTADELLAAYRSQVAESGMSDDQLDEFFRREVEAHRRPAKTIQWQR